MAQDQDYGSQEIYRHVLPAVKMLMAELNDVPDGKSIEERVHARLWPYVTHAVVESHAGAVEIMTPRRDKRTKPWRYVVRFWNISPIGQDLIAESEQPEIMQGTGNLPAIVAAYGCDVHSPEGSEGNTTLTFCPPELSEKSVKEKLEQLRNNLARQGSAVLRIPYDVGDESYLCQVDITSIS